MDRREFFKRTGTALATGVLLGPKALADEAEKFMRNAREVMGVMFTSDRVQMTDADIVRIYEESWR